MQGGPVLSGAVPASGHRPGGGGGPGHFAAGRDHCQPGRRHGAGRSHRPGAGGGAADGGVHLPPALPPDRRTANPYLTQFGKRFALRARWENDMMTPYYCTGAKP